MLLSTLTDVTPNEKRQRGQQGLCAGSKTQKGIDAEWLARGRARIGRFTVLTNNSRRTEKKRQGTETGERAAAVQESFEAVASKVHKGTQEVHWVGFYTHLKGMAVEGSTSSRFGTNTARC